MTSSSSDSQIRGSLRSADGKGIVRIEDRFDTGAGDLWSSTGSFNEKTAPWGSLDVAHSRPPCASTIERLIASPMPIPAGLVV